MNYPGLEAWVDSLDPTHNLMNTHLSMFCSLMNNSLAAVNYRALCEHYLAEY